MTIRNRVRYCDRCGKSLRGQEWMNAAGFDFHLSPMCSISNTADEQVGGPRDTRTPRRAND